MSDKTTCTLGCECEPLACFECDGDGLVECWSCGGSGTDEDYETQETEDCDECQGDGRRDCENCEGSGTQPAEVES